MTLKNDLGRLERIPDIRGIWPDEARDFTPWLALPENLALLAEALGLGPDGLELEGVEMNVGPFRADILCSDTNSAEGDRVLIENQYARYRTALSDYVATQSTPLRPRKPRPRQWTGFSIGRSTFELNANAVERDGRIGAELRIYSPDAKGFLAFLEPSRTDIEEACGFSLTWDHMEGREGGRATVERRGVSISDAAQWPDQHKWLFSKLDSMHRAFHSLVRALDPDSLALI